MRAYKRLFAGLVVALGCLSQPGLAQAQSLVNDDTDLFRINPNVAAERPNILIILDNTANWNQPFVNEKGALVTTVNGLTDIYNVGLMMFDESGGGNQTNLGGYVRFGIRQMTFANKTALATMVGNLDILGDKGNNADSDLAMLEAYLYFHSLPSFSSWGQVKTDYTGNMAYNPLAANLPGNALIASPTSGTPFNNPITSGCAKNYIIYISNGPANENSNELSMAQNFLQQISGQTPSIIPLSPASQQANWADEYAKFMSTDTVPVTTYTVDVNPTSTGNGPGWTAVLKSMASNSGGKYFAASDANGGASIVAALQKIFTDVQAVNSVYAATSLPVSVNVRGTNIDQVYIGMFRPDANDAPRWHGNLKMYQLAIDSATGNLYLADATGANAQNSATGFITSTAQSYWTTGSSFWAYRPSIQNGAGGASDLPDGDLVEKGAVAEMLRVRYASDQSARNLYTCTQGSYANCIAGSPLSSTPFGTANTDITSAALSLGSNPVSPLTGYESKAVTAITDRLDVSLNNLAAPTAVTSLDNGGRSVAVTSLTTATSQAISSLTDIVTGPVTYNVTSITKSGSTFTVTIGGAPSPQYIPNGGTVNFAASGCGTFNGFSTSVTSTPGMLTFSFSASGTAPSLSGCKVSGIASTPTTVVRATVPAHGFTSGEAIAIAGASPSAYNGTYNITVLDADRFSYAIPVAQTTDATPAGTASGTSTNAVATAAGHGFANGQSIAISGATPAGYNGTHVISNVTANTFSYTVASPLTPNVSTSVLATGGATTTVTATTASAHGFTSGQWVGIAGASDPGYNGPFSVTVTGTNTFTYTTAAPLPVNTASAVYVSGATQAAVTATTSQAHGFYVGQSVVIAGASPGPFNGTFTVASAPSPTSFTFSTGSALAPPSGTPTVQASTPRAWVTVPAHGYSNAQTVTLTGAIPNGYNATGAITVLDANGFTLPLATAPGPNTSPAVVSKVMTTAARAHSVNHGFSSGDSVTISGATPSAFNGTYTVAVIDSDNFTYTLFSQQGDAGGAIYASSGSANSAARTGLIDWVRGRDNAQDENQNGLNSDARASIHGDVLHSQPAVINYNRRTGDPANINNDIYVFYGANDGVFHAVKGGSGSSVGDPAPGTEVWGFVPEEFFGKLNRLRNDSPPISSSFKKPYFADGPVGTYTKDGDNDRQLSSASDVVNIYVAMHRGGRFLYALDVLDPLDPKFLWRQNSWNLGMGELGQTWSQPTVVPRINATSNPAIIMGAGYDDQAEDHPNATIVSADATSVTTATGTYPRTMGRGIFVLDALDGRVIFEASGHPRTDGSTFPYLVVPGMDCSIPANATVTRERGGAVYDRAYFGDTCGNVWRLDFSDANPANWRVTRLASLGSFTSAPDRRKFLFSADVVYQNGYDSVLIGSGNRETPFDTSVTNRFYMIKDYATGALATDASGNPLFPTVTEATLFDATSDCIADPAGCPSGVTSTIAAQQLASANGWYITLSLGELDVGAAVAVGGTVFFNTNIPATVAQSQGTCTANLGTARQYAVSVADATPTVSYFGSTGGIIHRHTTYAGGGFLPSPVPVTVNIGGKTVQAIISGTSVVPPPGTTLNTRVRGFWYREME